MKHNVCNNSGMAKSPSASDREAALDAVIEARRDYDDAARLMARARKRRDAAIVRAVRAGATDAMLGKALLITRQGAGQLARRAGAAARRPGRKRS